jgi:hypothetical protein
MRGLQARRNGLDTQAVVEERFDERFDCGKPAIPRARGMDGLSAVRRPAAQIGTGREVRMDLIFPGLDRIVLQP